MKEKSVFIFTPNSLNCNKTGFLKGCYKEINGHDSYFIVDDVIYNHLPIGKTVGKITSSKSSKADKSDKKCLYIDNITRKISVNNKNCSIVQINYDFHTFKKSDVLHMNCDSSYGEHFKTLGENLKESSQIRRKFNYERIIQVPVKLALYVINLLLKTVRILL